MFPQEMVRVFRERCTSTCKALWEVPSADAFLVKFLDYLLELSQLLQRLFFLENSSADHSSSPMEERLLAFEFLLSRGPDEWVQWLLLKGMQSSSVGTENQRSFYALAEEMATLTGVEVIDVIIRKNLHIDRFQSDPKTHGTCDINSLSQSSRWELIEYVGARDPALAVLICIVHGVPREYLDLSLVQCAMDLLGKEEAKNIQMTYGQRNYTVWTHWIHWKSRHYSLLLGEPSIEREQSAFQVTELKKI